jgi:hypothetical protein
MDGQEIDGTLKEKKPSSSSDSLNSKCDTTQYIMFVERYEVVLDCLLSVLRVEIFSF